MSAEWPDDAPEHLVEQTQAVYDEHELERLTRDVSDEPLGGAVWSSEDELVRLMHYRASGFWAVEAGEIRHEDDHRVIDERSNGQARTDRRSSAVEILNAYLSGEIESLAVEGSHTEQADLGGWSA